MAQVDVHRRNVGTLLRHLHLGGPVSRAVLAERMGLNRSTIMGLTAELAGAGLLDRFGVGQGRRETGLPTWLVEGWAWGGMTHVRVAPGGSSDHLLGKALRWSPHGWVARG